MPRAAAKKKEKVVKKPVKKAQPAKKAKKVVKKAVKKTPKKVNNGVHIWIYKDPLRNNELFEFHPALQEFLETKFKEGAKKAEVNIFTVPYTIDFQQMTRLTKRQKKGTPVQRILKSTAKKNKKLMGVQGAYYEKETRYTQDDNLCTICLTAPMFPTKLEECGHIFCYICVKGAYNAGMDCPTCRAEINRHITPEGQIRCDVDMHVECPEDYVQDCLDHVHRKWLQQEKEKRRKPKGAPVYTNKSEKTGDQKYYWIFKARNNNGWYRYDPKNELFIEECYLRQMKYCQLYICSHHYTIHFDTMMQDRNWAGEIVKRQIKRIKAEDWQKEEVRGIAGLDTVAYPVVKTTKK
ncbi:unnamed protein product [Caenorhabditis brenneri]